MSAQRYEPYKTADCLRRAEADAANQAAVEDAVTPPAVEEPTGHDAFVRFLVGLIIVLTILRAVNTIWLQYLISNLPN
ncbi:hypothetical protein BT96DRAFT_912400 [Gymnopus androsaceus JB14]|uniref:Uncharacterized protein n=1 Tax=Gymnopus androsaceus JB14 TaxID=1447944 RepID=A0A6A4ISZ4_9AGAR|nr:hypothetical protein BT96DRAFT_912400 [Gymnopus androsaceus JB14]